MAGQKELAHMFTDQVCRHGEAPGDWQEPPRKGSFSQYPVIGGLCRFFIWWLVFFGIYASSSVCVFCGTPGCPVGAGAAGIMGAFFAAMWTYGRALLDRLKEFIGRFGRFRRRDRHVTGPD